jgi:iron complex transport system substrate-binding protein
MSTAIVRARLLLLVLLPSPAPALTLTDQTGREVSLPAPPRRIVSLVPSVTEVLFAIAAQDRLAGVTDFCDYPPEARREPRVGGILAPNLETIITLKPDLVIATTAGNREETFVQLARLRIPVYLVDPTTMGDVLDLISRLGALTEHPVPAARLVAALDTRIRMVVGRVASLGRPRVLYVLWPEPVIVPGRGALVSELIARLIHPEAFAK